MRGSENEARVIHMLVLQRTSRLKQCTAGSKLNAFSACTGAHSDFKFRSLPAEEIH